MMRVACLGALLLCSPRTALAQAPFLRLGIGPSPAWHLWLGAGTSRVDVGMELLVVETQELFAGYGGPSISYLFVQPEHRLRPYASASLLAGVSFDNSETFATVGIGAGVSARLTSWLAAVAEARHLQPLTSSERIISQTIFMVGARLGRTPRRAPDQHPPAAESDGAP